LAAFEILETDLWVQYNELGGMKDTEEPSGSGNPTYTAALVKLDGDMPQYIHDNTDDEFTHEDFINAFLVSIGSQPVSLETFRTLQGSTATGSSGKARLTNLKELFVDTSWWTRYRDPKQNPDLNGFSVFAPAVPDLLSTAKGPDGFPAIPRDNNDLTPPNHIQAIANTAAFHFATIEQGGTSLYPTLAQNVTHPDVLRILLSIGPTEAMHFQTWQDKAGNAPPITDPTNGLTFPDLTSGVGELLQANLIMPEPCPFLSGISNPCSVVRPTSTDVFGAVVAFNGLRASNLFKGQSPAFFTFMNGLAANADAAKRLG
jgi:Ferritin-like domain